MSSVNDTITWYTVSNIKVRYFKDKIGTQYTIKSTITMGTNILETTEIPTGTHLN